MDIDLENWHILVLDPGHTHGRTIYFKQNFHLYWLMKSLLAKALEHIPSGVVPTTQGFQKIAKNFRKFELQKQNKCLSRIEQPIPCIPQTVLLSSSAKDLASVESVDDE